MSGIVSSIPYTGYGLDVNGYLTGLIGLKFPELFLGVSGSEVQLTADIGKLNAIGGGVSNVVVCNAASLVLTQALHAGRTIVQTLATGTAFTLPAATGTGDKYKIFIKTTMSGGSTTVSTASLDVDVFGTSLHATWYTDDGDTIPAFFTSTATMNTITLNGSTTGGISGCVVELQDVAAALWAGTVIGDTTGAEATPFSDV